MIQAVTDTRSNRNDQIRAAVDVLGKSRDRLRVFREIYRGKKAVKTVAEIAAKTELNQIRVLQEGKKLSANGIVHAEKNGQQTGYRKDPFYSANRARILQLVRKPDGLARFPTKTHPKVVVENKVVIKGIGRAARTEELFLDDIDSFSSVKKFPPNQIHAHVAIDEKAFKHGMRKLLGDAGKFTDWGGEKGDLLSSRLIYRGRRIAAAFAFKGKGTKGKLTPKKMGKNGDQIQRLFESAAEAFFIQYWADIDERVREQVAGWAELTSLRRGKKIYFCLIDGRDTTRLLKAYPKRFRG